MSISPTSPNLPGPSLDLLPSFPDKTETQAAPSNQKNPLKDRVCSFADRVGYKIYSIYFNPPIIMPEEFAEVRYESEKRKFFEKKPQSYEEAKAKVLNDPLGLCEWSWGHRLEKKYLELYSDPEFRKERVKAYADRLFYGTAKPPWHRKEEHWLIMAFCEEELHDLYRREPKYLRQKVTHSLWQIKDHNKPILAKHKKEWDQLLPSEKAEKIFGKRRKYEVTAGISIVTACFFLCQYLSLYQRLQSPQQPSTF